MPFTPEVDTFSVPNHLFRGPFHVLVKVLCDYEGPDDILEMEPGYVIHRRARVEEDESSDDEEYEYTSPIETYRQDKCIICLEAPPSILYLDCMHIAV